MSGGQKGREERRAEWELRREGERVCKQGETKENREGGREGGTGTRLMMRSLAVSSSVAPKMEGISRPLAASLSCGNS